MPPQTPIPDPLSATFFQPLTSVRYWFIQLRCMDLFLTSACCSLLSFFWRSCCGWQWTSPCNFLVAHCWLTRFAIRRTVCCGSLLGDLYQQWCNGSSSHSAVVYCINFSRGCLVAVTITARRTQTSCAARYRLTNRYWAGRKAFCF